MATDYVYALVDPRDKTIRYVGVSSNLDNRLKQHMTDATPDTNSDKGKWLYELKAAGLMPTVTILEVTTHSAYEREFSWIQFLVAMGTPLTNKRYSERQKTKQPGTTTVQARKEWDGYYVSRTVDCWLCTGMNHVIRKDDFGPLTETQAHALCIALLPRPRIYTVNNTPMPIDLPFVGYHFQLHGWEWAKEGTVNIMPDPELDPMLLNS